MAPRKRRSRRSLRGLAEARLAETGSTALGGLASDEVQSLIHDLEVHRVELEIQNQQLLETQAAAQESEDRYRRLYEAAPVGLLTLDPAGVIVAANRFTSALLELPPAELLGRTFASFVTEESQDDWYFARRALFESDAPQSFELDLRLDSGSVLKVQIAGSGHSEGPATRSLGLLDVTQVRNAQRELRRAAGEASLAEERERRKLAADFHDDAGQLLSLASIKLRALAEEVGAAWGEGFREVRTILAEVRRRVTSMSFQLSPPLLHDVGLVAAAHWLAEDLNRRYGTVVRVEAGSEIALDEVTRIALFRAARELLINASKHSGTTRARVRIWTEEAMVHLEVADEGVGFARDADRGGFGLVGLRERIAHLGGTLTVESGPEGTRIMVRVPTRDGGE